MMSVYAYQMPALELLEVRDEDAADFLQSQFSNDLQPFRSGRCSYGLWLDVKGKVVADSYVLQLAEERFLLYSVSSCAETIREKLDRHIIADDVELELVSRAGGFALWGPGIKELFATMGWPQMAAGHFANVSGGELLPVWGGVDGRVDLLVADADSVQAFRDRLETAGVEFVSAEQLQLARVEVGWPAVPVELGAGDLPGEGALESVAVSFTKGCYLGQEVVARMHNLGTPRRALYRVSGEGALPEAPQAVLAGERKAGELRSAYTTATGWCGVAMLKLAQAEGELSCAGGALQVLERMVAKEDRV